MGANTSNPGGVNPGGAGSGANNPFRRW
jgi:hypothetical protein